MSAVALAALVALRLDGPDGVCPAWMESADRRCGKPATVGLLCARHHKVAEARMVKAEAASVRYRERHRAQAVVRLPRAEEELADVERKYAALNPTSFDDGAVVNVALSRRMPSDSRIAELARLGLWRDRLRSEVAGLRKGLGR